jgi:hypothetical protein
MAVAYYGSHISEHLVKTPEGYLICYDVPINRTGTQMYTAGELGLEGEPERPVTVYRLEEDVFSPAALASLEGKDITRGHPAEMLAAENQASYSKGHLEHVRRDGDNTVADLIIKDPVRLRLEVARLIASAGSYPDIDCSIHRRSALPAPYVDAPSLEYGDWFSRAVPPLILAVKLGRGLDLPAGHADELVSGVSSPHGDHLALLPPYQGHPEGYVLRSAQRGGGDDHIRLSGIAAGKAMGHIPANGLRTKGHHSPSFPALWGLRAA